MNNISSFFSRYNVLLLILLFVGFIIFGLKSSLNFNDYLTWDEVHYATLAEKGIAYNALEKNSLNFIAFYKIGKARADKDTLLNNELVKKYNYPDENLNPFYLRHYHPPLATYYWSLFTLNPDVFVKDKNLRKSNVLLGVLAVLVFFFSLIISKVFRNQTFSITLIFSIILVSSNIFHYSFESINFHTFQFIFSILFVSSLLRWLNETNNKNAILLGVSTALMFLTLETALFIVCGAFLAILITNQLKKKLKSILISLIAFLGTLVVLWPGILKTLSPIKTWIMYAARIFLKGNDEYVEVDMAKAWQELFFENIVLFMMMTISLIFLLYFRRKKIPSKNYYVPYVIAFFYLITITPFIINKTYIFPAIGLFLYAIIYHASIINFEENNYLFSGWKKIVISLFLIVTIIHPIIGINYTTLKESKKKERIDFNDDIEELKVMFADKLRIVAFNGQLFRYYLDNDLIIDLRKNKKESPGFYIRDKGLYKNIEDQIKKKQIDGIIIPNKFLNYYPDKKTKFIEEIGYTKKSLKNFQVFILE